MELLNLKDNAVELENCKDEESFVLLWNPGHGLYQRVLPDVRGWDENPAGGAKAPDGFGWHQGGDRGHRA